MFDRILCAALFILPLCGPLTIAPIIDIKDLWKTKEFLAILAVALLCVVPVSRHDRAVNWPLKAMLVFVVLATFLIPPIAIQIDNENLGGLWCWRAVAWAFGYFLLYQRISSAHFDRVAVAKAIGWGALLTASYALVQLLNIDQFQITRPDSEIGAGHTHPEMTAMIGSSVYVSVWLGICLPFCFYILRWYQTAVVAAAIFLTGSDTGILFGTATVIFMLSMRARSNLYLKTILLVIALAGGMILGFWPQLKPIFKEHASGRYQIWSKTIKDWQDPCIVLDIKPEMSAAQKREIEILNKRTWTMTGRGMGSFDFIFQRKMPGWNDPHCVYLRVLYETGLIGLGLFLGMIGLVLWKGFSGARQDPWKLAVYCSLVFCCLAAVTTPLLIIEPLRFYCVIIFSMATIL